MPTIQEFYKVNGKLVLSGGNAVFHWATYDTTIISTGRLHSLGMNSSGKVWGWGYNLSGQLGDNSVVCRYTPVSILGANKTFCKIAGGQKFTLGIDKNGRIWGWGNGYYGQLGNNSATCKCTPVSILGANKTFCSIDGGFSHTLSLDKNGKVWCWGYNVDGELGDNTGTSRRTPVSMLGANKTFCSISAGAYFSAGLDKNGRVWCWGSGLKCQLGNNAITNKCTPVSILGANKTFCSIDGGYAHTLALDKNGRLWGWGYNYMGQLGINTVTNRCTPVSVLGANKTFCKISAGGYFSLGIDKNGRIWGWGHNGYGQLGDNTIAYKCTPVSILGANKTFCSISVGYTHSLGIDKNGRVWGWGINDNGQLGDNTVTSKLTPVMITTI